MTYGPSDVARDLRRMAGGDADFDVRARLEHHLLAVLPKRGADAVGALLQALPDHRFARADDAAQGPDTIFRSHEPGAPILRIAVQAGVHVASVDVSVEEELSASAEPDPRHRAFYSIWEQLLRLPDAAADPNPAHRAVFLIGLLEAEVMNGGLGQYLANTDGAHVEATLECLERIGAVTTRALLIEAETLGREADGYIAAWESRFEEFAQLDEDFLNSGEDLAAMTADIFLTSGSDREPDRGS